MNYIETAQALSESDILELCERIEQGSTPFIDGNILSVLVMVCFFCGLKKQELIDLKIRDVINRDGNLLDIITIQKLGVPLTDDAKTILRRHLNYLQNKGYKRLRSSPLFPKKDKGSYTPKKLQYDLQEFLAPLPENIRLEKIRQSGICRYYDQLRDEGRSSRECIEKTSVFARSTKKHTTGILEGNIQKTGRKIHPVMRYLEEIEMCRFGSYSSQEERKRALEEIAKEIDVDDHLSEKDRKALQLEIGFSIKQ
jgi:hypothetical protein